MLRTPPWKNKPGKIILHNQKESGVLKLTYSLLLRDQNGFNDSELKFLNHQLAHVDFLIFDPVTKEPLLVIEIDGRQHEVSKQTWRDLTKDRALTQNNIKILRIPTGTVWSKQKIKEEIQNKMIKK